MRVAIRYKGKVHEWEVWPHGMVQQLQPFVQNKWGIKPAQQRFQIDGLLMCTTLRLGLFGDGVEFRVLDVKQGGGFKKEARAGIEEAKEV